MLYYIAIVKTWPYCIPASAIVTYVVCTAHGL